MKTLKDAKIGQTVTVVKVHGEGAVRRRIMDMGITKRWRFLCGRLHRWEIPLKSTSGAMS